MEYLKTVLDIQVTYKSIEDLHLPNFIMSRYRIRKVFMDSVEAFFCILLRNWKKSER